MGSRLNPYLGFHTNAREAMEFYREVFGGELTLSTFGEYGQTGTPDSDLVMHAQLETPSGYTLMGADTPSFMEYQPSSATVSLSGGADVDAELRGYWDRLSAGGTVTTALEKQMWGDVFGMCVDRFGTSWLVNIGTDAS